MLIRSLMVRNALHVVKDNKQYISISKLLIFIILYIIIIIYYDI